MEAYKAALQKLTKFWSTFLGRPGMLTKWSPSLKPALKDQKENRALPREYLKNTSSNCFNHCSLFNFSHKTCGIFNG